MLKGMSLHKKYLATILLTSRFSLILTNDLIEVCALGMNFRTKKGEPVEGIVDGVDEDCVSLSRVLRTPKKRVVPELVALPPVAISRLNESLLSFLLHISRIN